MLFEKPLSWYIVYLVKTQDQIMGVMQITGNFLFVVNWLHHEIIYQNPAWKGTWLATRKKITLKKWKGTGHKNI